VLLLLPVANDVELLCCLVRLPGYCLVAKQALNIMSIHVATASLFHLRVVVLMTELV